MTVQLTKDSIDLGIHVKDPEKSLTFYRDTLGFEQVGEMDMHRQRQQLPFLRGPQHRQKPP